MRWYRHRATRGPNQTFTRSTATTILEHPPSQPAIRSTQHASEHAAGHSKSQVYGTEHARLTRDGTEATSDSPRDLHFHIKRRHMGLHGTISLPVERSPALRLTLCERRSDTTLVGQIGILHHRCASNGHRDQIPHLSSIRLGKVPRPVEGGVTSRPLVLESVAIFAIYLPRYTQRPQSPVSLFVATAAVYAACCAKYVLENVF